MSLALDLGRRNAYISKIDKKKSEFGEILFGGVLFHDVVLSYFKPSSQLRFKVRLTDFKFILIPHIKV
jgi:hypothetical protein